MYYDKDFLRQLDLHRNKKIYARITALNWAEEPLDMIEGRITQGSINIDGQSAVRRTCSATIVAQNFDFRDYYWGLNTKFKMAIGVENVINSAYPDIIWFEQGVFVLTSFNTSRSTNNFTISLQGKDKMCLLNGEVGGKLESTIDFGQIEEEIDGIWTIRKLPISDIIRNAVHVYGGEPYHNIIIKDLDTVGAELLEYRHEIPLYLYRQYHSNKYENVLMENDYKLFHYQDDLQDNKKSVKELDIAHLDTLTDGLIIDKTTQPVYTSINNSLHAWQLAKINYGDTAGYRETDLVYAGDLIANVGESLTSVLDKIRNMLVEFEYFYDLEGRFIFQKKQSFVETFWRKQDSEQAEQELNPAIALSTTTAYSFDNHTLITAFNNNPNLLNARNDYSIWGERVTASGATVPIHLRYAIDVKPIAYKQITVTEAEIARYNELHGTQLKSQLKPITYISSDEWNDDDKENIKCDWREVIYQMAQDYYKYGELDDFTIKIAQANPSLYPLGYTGYENYYIDLQGFWRDLYDPSAYEERFYNIKKYFKILEQYDPNTEIQEEKDTIWWYTYLIQQLLQDNETIDTVRYIVENMPWNSQVKESPYNLNFWFEFLDTEGELQQFSVRNIGHRSKPVSDNNVKSIYYRETPSIMFVKDQQENSTINAGFTCIQMPNMDEIFTISARGKSAKDKLDELIYQHGYCIESISITSIPIYYLQPNTRIAVFDADTGIDGEYIVSKITIPLAYNGTMSITATKAAERII